MNILSDVKKVLEELNIPAMTGAFKDNVKEKYVVLIPLADSYPISADNMPITDVQELRITLFSKENYIKLKNQLILSLLKNEFYITERKYNSYETDTGYYQYTIDVAKNYEIEED